MLSFWKKRLFKKIITQNNSDITIYTKKNPDSDSLASCLSLKRIAQHFNINAEIYYTGVILNKTLVNILGDDIKNTPEYSFSQNKIALIDLLPTETTEQNLKPTMVITRSFTSKEGIKSDYKDIRATKITSTIMIEYLKEFKVAIDKRLATLLFYAIREKSNMLTINFEIEDLKAYSFIYNYIDLKLLNNLEHPSVRLETFEHLSNAISNKIIKRAYLITNVGYVKESVNIVKLCKYMLDIEGVFTALIYSVDATMIHIYAETKNMEINMKTFLTKAFGKYGEIDGGTNKAWGSINLGVFGTITEDEKERKELLKGIKKAIVNRYFEAIESG